MAINVFIHVGPPKTGTSAIQNWLHANTERLAQHGVHYPTHNMDQNGVSSGNLLSLFDREDDKSLSFNEEKAIETRDQAQQAGAHTLLLSSEFFFRRLNSVLSVFPDAKVIAYIRDPLDVIESGYNQGVKRHYQTKPLKVSHEPKTATLDLLAKQVKQFGTDAFIIRPYDFSLFEGGDIVTDFLSVLGLEGLTNHRAEIINSSYVFEALEFKRWMNQFEHRQLHLLLDRFLQGHRDGTATFSLVTEKKRKAIRHHFNRKLKTFISELSVQQGSAFLTALKNKPLKPYKKQQISEEVFTGLLEAFIRSNSDVIFKLEEARTSNMPETLRAAHFYPVFENVVSRHYRRKQRYRMLLRVSRKVKRVLSKGSD